MRRISKLLLAAVFVAVLAVPAVALAQPGDSSRGSNQAPETASARQSEATQIREQAQAKAEEAKTKAEDIKNEITTRVEERRAQIKKEFCERRQQSLAKVMPRLAQGATSVKQSFDIAYERVVGFYESGQLTVSNYDELVGNVEAAKANAASAVSAAENYQFELDCENPNVGEQLDAFRLAVDEAKAALNEYRQALVELISAMRAAAALEQET
ncbi:MAG: hypothetical protein ACREGD_04255 [Candidatus Saccharimonadales bacterium]